MRGNVVTFQDGWYRGFYKFVPEYSIVFRDFFNFIENCFYELKTLREDRTAAAENVASEIFIYLKQSINQVKKGAIKWNF